MKISDLQINDAIAANYGYSAYRFRVCAKSNSHILVQALPGFFDPNAEFVWDETNYNLRESVRIGRMVREERPGWFWGTRVTWRLELIDEQSK